MAKQRPDHCTKYSLPVPPLLLSNVPGQARTTKQNRKEKTFGLERKMSKYLVIVPENNKILYAEKPEKFTKQNFIT